MLGGSDQGDPLPELYLAAGLRSCRGLARREGALCVSARCGLLSPVTASADTVVGQHRRIVLLGLAGLVWASGLLFVGVGTATGEEPVTRHATRIDELHGPLLVEATAYNSVEGQTEGDPEIGAWGDRLDPGVKSVAVSNDLLALGMSRGARVRIEGLPGVFLVLDRMPPQWRRRIDIHMGDAVDVARQWGRRRVRIYWQTP